MLKQQILESPLGKAFLLKLKKNELIEQELRRLMKIDGQKCYEEYKNISCKTRVNNLLPPELTDRKEDMILNATFFINHYKVTDFVRNTNHQEEKYRAKGFSFDVTGPWAPHNFVKLLSE